MDPGNEEVWVDRCEDTHLHKPNPVLSCPFYSVVGEVAPLKVPEEEQSLEDLSKFLLEV